MPLLSIILCFMFISWIPVTPITRERKDTRIFLPGFNLGLKASSTHHGNSHTQRMKNPVYMMELYKALIMANDTSLTNLERPVLQQSDVVLSLIAKDYNEAHNRWTLSFDISSISSNIDLILVKFRIRLSSFERSQRATVEIYDSRAGQEKHFVGSFTTNPSSTPSIWKVFNLTKMLQCYLHQDHTYPNGQYINAEDESERIQETSRLGGNEDLLPNELPNTPQQNEVLHKSYSTAERVMLVIFAKDKPSSNPSVSSSLIMAAQSSKYVKRNSNTTIADMKRHRRNLHKHHPIVMNNIKHRPVQDGMPLCKRVDMFVDFEKLGWGDRIIYPKRYNAYRCEGACPIPLEMSVKPTNHAFIKPILIPIWLPENIYEGYLSEYNYCSNSESFVKLYDDKKVECSSCAPVKMSALSMLYFKNGTEFVSHFEDMVVEACGCY